MSLNPNHKLIAVGALSGIVSIVLLIFTFQNFASIDSSNQKIQKQRKQVQSLLQMPVKSTQGNLDKVQKDCAQLTERMYTLEKAYGHPSQKYLEIFCSYIGISTDSFITLWKKCNEGNKMLLDYDAVRPNLLAVIKETSTQDNVAVLKRAEERTISALSRTHLTPISHKYIIDELMVAIGTPLPKKGNDCKTEMMQFLADVKKSLAADSVMVPAECNFGFDNYINSVPMESDIPIVEEQMRIIACLGAVITQSKIKQINSIVLDNTNPEVDKDGFKTYVYTLKITGNIQSIRSFLYHLADAIKSYHFFTVDRMSLSALSTEVESLLRPQNPMMQSGSPKKEEVDLSPCVVGKNKEVSAEIRLKYIIYTSQQNKESK